MSGKPAQNGDLMKLILIRHGEPDYEHDGLTEKGRREASLLAERILRWNVKDIYVSSLGRAKETAKYTLEALHREPAEVCEWMKEFYYPVTDPVTGRYSVPWDFMPGYFTDIPVMYDKDKWSDAEVYKQNPAIPGAYRDICTHFDETLLRYGYRRIDGIAGGYYEHLIQEPEEDGPESALLFFCHLGLTCVLMSHLMGISPALLWHGLYLAPTSVTVFNCEERMDHAAWFRAQVIGDTSHLREGNEPVSASGAFSEVFDL